MQDYAERADELVAQLDAGEIAPEEIDVTPFVEREDMVFTPELRDRLDGTGKVEEYNQRVQERQRESLAEERREREEDYADAIAAISDPTLEHTEPVVLNDQEFQVKNYLPGDMERKLAQITQAEQEGAEGMDQAREATIDLIMWLIDGPEEYLDEGVWRQYANKYGIGELQKRAVELAQPYRERQQELSDSQSFRDE